MNIVIHDHSGRIVAIMRLKNAAEADLNTRPGEAWVEGVADLGADMVRDGEIVPRPRVAALPAGGTAPLTLALTGYPEGTIMRAMNTEGDVVETADPLDPITLTQAGGYAVAVEPPFPWLGVSATVVVTDA